MTEEAPAARASPLLSPSFPLVSPHIRSPFLFLTSVCLSFSQSIRHHERFTALLLADLADQALRHTRRHNPALTDLSLSRETTQREEDGTKVRDDYRATAPLCAFLCLRACMQTGYSAFHLVACAVCAWVSMWCVTDDRQYQFLSSACV